MHTATDGMPQRLSGQSFVGNQTGTMPLASKRGLIRIYFGIVEIIDLLYQYGSGKKEDHFCNNNNIVMRNDPKLQYIDIQLAIHK